MYGDFTIIEGPGRTQSSRRVYIGDDGSRNEAWLRDLVITHPEVLPIGDVDPTFGPLRPLCAELRTEAGPVDAAFINEHGRLTLVECKLWKNPQARREVVGQILDYVSALSRWSYADLQRQVAMASGEQGNVPYAKAGTSMREPQFIDAVGKSLREGRVLALIVGDGIRDEVQRLAETINRNVSKAFTLGLIEVALYESADGQKLLVQPRVLAKTETISRYLTVVNGAGEATVIQEEMPAEETREAAARGSGKQHLKQWWQPVLDMKFDDPEQEPPFWVGTNNVVLNTPFPGVQIKAYAKVGAPRMEVFLSGNAFAAPLKRNMFGLMRSATAVGRFLQKEYLTIEDALPPGTRIELGGKWPVRTIETEIVDDDERRAWIIATMNSYVNVLRPRLRRWYEDTTKG